MTSTIRHAHDALVVALHCATIASGFQFIGLGDVDSGVPPTTEVVLPEGWNYDADVYSLRYRSVDGTEVLLIKSLIIVDHLVIHCIPITTTTTGAAASTTATREMRSMEVNVREFIHTEGEGVDLKRPLTTKALFNVEKLLSKFIKDVLRHTPPEPHVTPLRFPPSRIAEPHQPPFSTFVPPLGVGGDDLEPFGGIGIGPQHHQPVSGVFPRSGGGSLVGPDHPMFWGRGRGNGASGLPTGVPPGARFDPFGPPVPGMGPAHGRGVPPSGTGRGTGPTFPFGDPDPDHQQPPPSTGGFGGGGYSDMFL